MRFRYLLALVAFSFLFPFGCTTSSQADPEALRMAEREAELDRKMEAMRIAFQILEGSEFCRGGPFPTEEFFEDYCLSDVEKAYHLIIETVTQE